MATAPFNEKTIDEAAKGLPGYTRRWRSRILAIIGLAVAGIIIASVVLTLGSVKIPFGTVWSIIISHIPFINLTGDWTDAANSIVWDIRLPRVIMAGLTGAALGVAGATYQGLFRNPLADPYLIGVAQGASLGAAAGFLLPWVFLGIYLVPVLAFVGALVAVIVVYFTARVGKNLSTTTLILSGVAIGAFLISVTSYLTLIDPEKTHGIYSWLMGSFAMTEWQEVGIAAPYIVIGILAIMLFARPLNVMQLDEEQAQQLGIHVESTKLILLAISTLITAAAVCFVGTIGFVGIIVPHAMRLVWGPDHRSLLPLSAIAGAILLVLADTVSRTAMPPSEIAVGVITAFLGAPFFIFLLRRKKRAVF